uniref:PHD-type domain-containing protein n=1 Tax=Anopheles farauti TaxID=69004 RepID=A0A182Q964_9DIPT
MVNNSQKEKIIKEFHIPDTLKDDIAYCQRSLRDCVKVHQYFVQICKNLTILQQEQVRMYLLELEDEMRAIGKDQSGLVQDLAKRLKHFQRKMANEKHVELGDDFANGYVAWVLSNHFEMPYNSVYVPHGVSERLNETQLYQKYRLEPLVSCNADTSLPDVTSLRDTRLRKRPVLQTSLLKPKDERDLSNTASKEKKPSLTPPSTPPSSLTPPTPPAPVIARTITTVAGNRRSTPPEQPVTPPKMLRSRSIAPVVTVKQEPKVKQEPMDQETGGIDSEDQISPKSIRESAAVKRGRNNLLQALNKVKTTQKNIIKQSQTSPPASVVKAGRNNRASSVNAGEHRSASVSSDSSNSRASTPGSSNSTNARKPAETGGIDECVNERLLPLEETIPSWPTNIDEWEQYGFLKLFGLYTIEDSNLLKGRKNERKRRSCCSTERKDFHYGRFDYYEQQFYIVQKRRCNVNKRLLYTTTPAEKSIKKRKPWSNEALPPPASLPASDVAVEPDTKPSLEPASTESVIEKNEISKLLEPDNKMCFVCNKVGTTETLSACMECCNIYHLSCHTDEVVDHKPKEKTAYNAADDDGGDESDSRPDLQRDNLCPVCLALVKNSKK